MGSVMIKRLVFLIHISYILTLTEGRKVLVTKIRFSTVPDQLNSNVTAIIQKDTEPVEDLSKTSTLDRNEEGITGLHRERARHPGLYSFGPQRPLSNKLDSKKKKKNNKDKKKILNYKSESGHDANYGFDRLGDKWNGNSKDSKLNAKVPGPKIVGGSQSSPNGWPSEASIQYYGMDGYWYHFCGGSLIHREWVVTVAHCLIKLENYIIRVVLGDYRLGSLDGREQIRLPSNVLVHTYFNKPQWSYDIGLIKLQNPATINNFVQTARLATRDMEPLSREHECYVAGWGSIFGNEDSLVTPDYLQQTRMTVIGQQDCTNQLEIHNVLIDSHICMENDFSSVCIGDSGSPLQCYVDGHWVLVGLASWIRDKLCEPSVPNVFTRMSSFNSWCLSVMEQFKD